MIKLIGNDVVDETRLFQTSRLINEEADEEMNNKSYNIVSPKLGPLTFKSYDTTVETPEDNEYYTSNVDNTYEDIIELGFTKSDEVRPITPNRKLSIGAVTGSIELLLASIAFET